MKTVTANHFEHVLKINLAKQYIDSWAQLADRCGLTTLTLFNRRKDPGSLRLFELRALINELNMPYEDILELVLDKEIHLEQRVLEVR